MLLIVFVENAFKHSKKNEDEKVFINLVLKVEGDTLIFSADNSCLQPLLIAESPRGYSGFGLESVRKRLDLLYPDRNDLKINSSEKTYSVNLKLKYK
jgi:sensor histidine kinase YesM